MNDSLHQEQSYRGAAVAIRFNGIDVSGDGRALTLDDAYGSLEALDVTGAWSARWESLAEGAEGSLVVTEDGVEREHFDAVVRGCSLKSPSDDLTTVSVSFETI